MAPEDVIRHFYDHLSGQSDAWQRDLAENVVFSDASGKLRADGRDAFIQSYTGFLSAVERVQLRQLIVNGEDAAATVSYDYRSPSGGKLRQNDAEIWKVVDGKIVAMKLYFDITEFRAFMAR